MVGVVLRNINHPHKEKIVLQAKTNVSHPDAVGRLRIKVCSHIVKRDKDKERCKIGSYLTPSYVFHSQTRNT